MIRRLFFDLLLFLLPFAAYFLYVRLERAHKKDAAPERITPWMVLTIVGLLFVIASFIWLGLSRGLGREGVYVAPHLENGVVVPGHVEKNETPQ